MASALLFYPEALHTVGVTEVDIASFFSPHYLYAIVGASADREKYGYRVLKDLAGAGYRVVGVNPHLRELEGVSVYPNLASLPHRPDVAVVVVPPHIGLAILNQADRLGIRKVWFQPGAESQEIQQRIAEFNLTGVADGRCIMVTRRTLKTDVKTKY